MTDRYDAIIIGSGLGGLSSAATLSKRGLKVRLLEKHTQPGGYATTFFRGRFEFEVSLHALSGIGTPDNPGPLFHQLDALDVARRVDFIAFDNLYRSYAPGLDLMVPKGVNAYTEALCERFPKDAAGIRNLVRQVLTVGYEVDLLRDGGYSTSPLPTLMRFPNMVHAAGVSLATVLDRELTDPLAKLAVGQIWTYFGLPPSKLSFLLFAVGLNMHLLYGSAGLKGKSQSLSNSFVEVIREAGGEVSFSNGAAKIIVENGRIQGVLTEHGERIESDTVIANANPVTTLTELVDAEALPAEIISKVSSLPHSVGSVNLYLGLSEPSNALGIDEYEIYLNQMVDTETQYATCHDIDAPGCLTMCAYDLINPTAAPAGAGMITATALSEGEVWSTLNPAAYREAKEAMASHILDQVTARFPDIAGRIETIALSTPVTNMRYTGNPGGAIYGFANTPELNPGFRWENKGPIPGLWFVGAWSQPGGGFQATISSGIIAAEAIIDDLSGTGRIALPPPTDQRQMLPEPPNPRTRKWRGLGQVLRDGKQVKQTISSKYAKPRDDLPPVMQTTVSATVNRFYAHRFPMVLTERIQESPDTFTLRLAPVQGEVPPFHSGQYFSVHVVRDGRETSRPFSASSSPRNRRYIDFTIKAKPDGDISKHLTQTVAVGDRVAITGPVGDFFYTPLRDNPHIVAVAAGSGITPFMSVLEDFAARQSAVPPLTLFYTARTPSEMLFGERLNQLSDTCSWFTFVPTLTQPTPQWTGLRGRLSAGIIQRHLGKTAMQSASFFICVPRRFCQDLVADLQGLGVERRHIRLEAYGPPRDITREADWPKGVKRNDAFQVKIAGMKKAIRATAGTSLLDSMEHSGIRQPALCRSGVCDACRVRLVKGEVFTPADELGLRIAGNDEDIHPCMSFPLSDISIVD